MISVCLVITLSPPMDVNHVRVIHTAVLTHQRVTLKQENVLVCLVLREITATVVPLVPSGLLKAGL